jgi:hypothetical protein
MERVAVKLQDSGHGLQTRQHINISIISRRSSVPQVCRPAEKRQASLVGVRRCVEIMQLSDAKSFKVLLSIFAQKHSYHRSFQERSDLGGGRGVYGGLRTSSSFFSVHIDQQGLLYNAASELKMQHCLSPAISSSDAISNYNPTPLKSFNFKRLCQRTLQQLTSTFIDIIQKQMRRSQLSLLSPID